MAHDVIESKVGYYRSITHIWYALIRPHAFLVDRKPWIEAAGRNVRKVESVICHRLVDLVSRKPDMNCPVCGRIFQEGNLVSVMLINVRTWPFGALFLPV